MSDEIIKPEIDEAEVPVVIDGDSQDTAPMRVPDGGTDPNKVHNEILTRDAYTVTKKEMAILKADPDPSAIQTFGTAIYMPHMQYRLRLTEAFGGRWALVPLCEAGKPFITTPLDDGKIEVTVHYALVVDNQFVGDAWGSGTYHPTNGMTNHGDALEGAKSDCLSRVGKDKLLFYKLWDKKYQADYKAGRLDGQSDPDESEMERPAHRPEPTSQAAPQQSSPPVKKYPSKDSGATHGVIEEFRPHNYTKYGKSKTMYFFTISGQEYTAFNADVGHKVGGAFSEKLEVMDVNYDHGRGQYAQKRTATSIEIAEPAHPGHPEEESDLPF